MTDDQRQRYRDEINGKPLSHYVTLEKSKGGLYCCPICGSGHGPKATGALKIYPDNRVVCHAHECFDNGGKQGTDTLGALRLIWNCTETEVFEKVGLVSPYSERKDRREDKPLQEQKAPQLAAQAPETAQDYSEYYQTAHIALWSHQEALDYLHGRGLRDDTIKHFFLGYDGGRIIIPLWSGGYAGRAIDPGEEIRVKNTGKVKPFHIEALKPETEEDPFPPVVVEGSFDAMTLWQWGFRNAIALNGLSTAAFIAEAKATAPDTVYLLALDNDQPGREAQQKAEAAFTEAKLSFISLPAEAYGSAKDANQTAQEEAEGKPDNAEKLSKAVFDYLLIARERQQEAEAARQREQYEKTGPGMVDRFIADVTSLKYKPLSTGIPAIDYATGGGFMKQTLVLLGAEPGAGKTALASMIFESMATHGSHTLYFNLEMSRNQLIARSLARIIYQQESKKISSLEVLQGYRYTPEIKALVEKAAARYKGGIANGILYNPGETGTSLTAILDHIEEEARRQEAEGNEAPLVVVDYLQLLRGDGREDAAETLKRAVAGFKDYAINHNSIVFAIMAQSRAANNSREASMSAGRDTSALEYTADLQLQLVREDETAPDTVTLYVTKNRFGAADTRKGHGKQFTFMGGQALFIPLDTDH